MSSQKILFITGGSGYIGSRVIYYALEAGYSVTALSRTPASDEKLRALGANPVRGDLETLSVLTENAQKATLVIAIADSIAGTGFSISPEERFRINDKGFAALVDGLEGTNKKIILTSGTAFVTPDPEGKETDETALSLKDSPFGRGMEGFAFEYAKKQGVNISAVRLAPWVYGRGGSGVASFMAMFAKAGGAFYVSPGTARTTTVHVDDAARLYLLVAENGRPGEVYNATFETDVTFRDLTKAIAEAIGVGLEEKSYEDTEKTTGGFIANFLRFDNRAGSEKAKKELGWNIEAYKGILEEVATGSYVEVAKNLRNNS